MVTTDGSRLQENGPLAVDESQGYSRPASARELANTWRLCRIYFFETLFLGSLHDCWWEGRFPFRIRLKSWFGLLRREVHAAQQVLEARV
jgi:hypothetical protein